jgi:hypothetical protein
MEKIITLKRISSNDQLGTYGVLLDGDYPFCVTLEPPWVPLENGDSTPFLSCIPAGVYEARRTNSPRFGNTFEIFLPGGDPIPGRTDILLHQGNWNRNTSGCILVAEGFGMDGMVERSSAGFREFIYRVTGYQKFLFPISEDY